ncbi:MAG: hypothetical protein AAB337_03175 [Patescibacteria group bacterium]
MNKTYTISFNQTLAKDVEKEMRHGKFENTSEFFRHIYRKYTNHREPFIIERVLPNDSDYKRSKAIKAKGRYTPLDQFLDKLS